jgi:predicted ATPase/class 3 adenylate cyclase
MLFTDIEQSTLLLTRLGPAYADALDACRAAQRAAWAKHGGVEMGTEGDSFFVVFATAEDAVGAAVDAQVALNGLAWPNGEQVRVRIGIHTGSPRIHDDGYVGIDVHRAARIAAAAHGGQVVVSDVTAKLVAGVLPEGVSLRALGVHRLKDLREPERLHQLVIPGLRADFPHVKSLRSVSSLPATTTPLVGREGDLDQVTALLSADDVRLVTLTGPGGVGKTRLAIDVARRLEDEFPEGAVFVALAPADTTAAATSAIAQGLGVLDTGDLPLGEKLVAAVGDRRLLLVLDNFEQITEASPLVGAMLSSAPGLRVLVTSRVLLRLSGEHNYPVNPLEFASPDERPWQPDSVLTPAVDLFVQRARSVKPDFELTVDNADAVERITAALDGVPLAIELAAARVRLLPPGALLERLDRQLSVLVGGQRDLPARHRTVRDTIQWSTDLLEEDERSLLCRVAVCAGPSSLEAISAVAADGDDVLGLIEVLVDASLLRQHERHGRAYFSLLATVREYGLEQLAAHGLLAEARSRHARFYADWATRQAADMLGPRLHERLATLTDERDNLRAAAQYLVDSHEWEVLADLLHALYPYWWLVGLLGEVRDRLDQLLRSGDPVSDHATAHALALSSIVGFFEGGAGNWADDLTRSAELYAATGDDVGRGNALTSLGLTFVMADPPDVARASECLHEGVRLLREAGATWWESTALIPLGRLYLLQGDAAAATEQFRRSLALGEKDENDLGIALSLNSLGWVTLLTGHVVEAAAMMERCLDLSIGLFYEHGIAYQLESFLAVAGALGDVERAGLLGGAALALRERLGLLNPSDAVLHLGMVEKIRSGPGAELYERSFQEGRRLSVDDAVAVAREVAAAAAHSGPRS